MYINYNRLIHNVDVQLNNALTHVRLNVKFKNN